MVVGEPVGALLRRAAVLTVLHAAVPVSKSRERQQEEEWADRTYFRREGAVAAVDDGLRRTCRCLRHSYALRYADVLLWVAETKSMLTIMLMLMRCTLDSSTMLMLGGAAVVG